MIQLLVSDVDEINLKQFRIEKDGGLTLPLLGRIKASGLTIDQLREEIGVRLKRYLRSPEVVVSVTEFRSQPVAVIGSVGLPGTYQVQGCRTLLEMLSTAGGIKTDAGNSIRVTRQLRWGELPLPGAHKDRSGTFSVAAVDIKSLMGASSPEDNILIAPGDVVSVPKAQLVYVVGAVRKPGGFVLEDDSMSVLQTISLAEGPDRTAAIKKAKILRRDPITGKRIEVSVDLSKLLSGKTLDAPNMKAEDILFVPNSSGKAIGAKTLDAAITAIAGAAIYRPF